VSFGLFMGFVGCGQARSLAAPCLDVLQKDEMKWRGIWMACVVLVNIGLLSYIAIVSEGGDVDYGDPRRKIDPEERHEAMLSRTNDPDLIYYLDRLFTTQQLARSEARDERSRRQFLHRWALSLAFMNLAFFVIAIYDSSRLIGHGKKSAEPGEACNAGKPSRDERSS
jgi:hypothetical protein